MSEKKIEVVGDEHEGFTLKIPVDWGETISFCADFILPEKRMWLGEVIQRQANEILLRKRHQAIEAHKEA